MAMTAWSAKVFRRSIWRSPNGPASRSRDGDRAEGDAVAQHGDRDRAAEGGDLRGRAENVAGVRLDVRDVRERCPGGSPAPRPSPESAPSARRGAGRRTLRGQPVVRHEVEALAVEPVDEAELGLAEPRRAPGERVENWLDVCRRARDDPQDLAGRRLLLQRLRSAHDSALAPPRRGPRSRRRPPPGRPKVCVTRLPVREGARLAAAP